MLRRAYRPEAGAADRIVPMKLLSRSSSRPGVIGTARVDRDIDRLLRRVGVGDIVVLDILDLDRVTADALVDAGVAGVVNASPSISGRYPNLGPEVLVANNIVLIDNAGSEIFKKIKDGAKIRLHDSGVYSGDRLLVNGVERTDEEIADLMHDAKTGLVAHLTPAQARRLRLALRSALKELGQDLGQ